MWDRLRRWFGYVDERADLKSGKPYNKYVGDRTQHTQHVHHPEPWVKDSHIEGSGGD